MTIVQSIDGATEERVGPNGVTKSTLEATLERSEEALSWMRARHDYGGLALLRLPSARDDLDEINATARRLAAGATDIVILGTGGSSLGGQTLAQIAGHAVPGVGAFRDPPHLHFLDNLDPVTLSELMGKLPLETSRFVVISKSGGTAETLMQAIVAMAALREAKHDLSKTMLGITEPLLPGRRNNLRALLDDHKVPILDHAPDVGGRYSLLTNVGLLPAALVGLDIAAVRQGAAAALMPLIENRPAAAVPFAVGAALNVALAETAGKTISVMLAYADRLERLTHWYVQLWAESLGKDGNGTTPVATLGPVDQHSQLQLFMAGPRDKLFTVVSTHAGGRGPRIDGELARRAGESVFSGRRVGDLVAAESRATVETLIRHNCPVRTIVLERVDERHIGELTMSLMLETIAAGQLLGVDPFDQPAVEEGKALAKRYLASEK